LEVGSLLGKAVPLCDVSPSGLNVGLKAVVKSLCAVVVGGLVIDKGVMWRDMSYAWLEMRAIFGPVLTSAGVQYVPIIIFVMAVPGDLKQCNCDGKRTSQAGYLEPIVHKASPIRTRRFWLFTELS
jgi:hypothetical protein